MWLRRYCSLKQPSCYNKKEKMKLFAWFHFTGLISNQKVENKLVPSSVPILGVQLSTQSTPDSFLSPEEENCSDKLFFTGGKITICCWIFVSLVLVSVLPPFPGIWHSVICKFQLSHYKKWVAWGHWFITGSQLCFHLLNDILKASILNIITLGYALSTALDDSIISECSSVPRT